MEWLATTKTGHLLAGLIAGAVAAVYLEIVTWRALLGSLGTASLLAMTAPEPMAAVMGLPPSGEGLLAVLFGLSGHALAERITKGDLQFWK